MNFVLNQLNMLAFVISPVFYKVTAMSFSVMFVFCIIFITEREVELKLPLKLKRLLIIFMMIILIVPFRFETKFAFNVGAFGNFETFSYREEYDAVQQELHEMMDNDTIPQADFNALKREEERIFYRSLLYDVTLPLVWLAGVIIWGSIKGISAYRFEKEIKQNNIDVSDRIKASYTKNKQLLKINKDAQIIVQNKVPYPAVTGVLKPKIILPQYVNQCDDDTLDYIMLHEMGHIKQGDLIINSVLFVLGVVYWFFSFIFDALRDEMERMNDSFIIQYLDPEQRKNYSKSLVAVLARCNNITIKPKLLGMTDTKINLEKRIKFIKKYDSIKKVGIIGCTVVIMLSMFLGLTKDVGRNNMTAIVPSAKAVEYITISRADRDYQIVVADEDNVKTLYDAVTTTKKRNDDAFVPFEIPDSLYENLYNMEKEKYVITFHLKEKQSDGNAVQVQFRINEGYLLKCPSNGFYYNVTDKLRYIVVDLNSYLLEDEQFEKICSRYNKEIEFIENKHDFTMGHLDRFTLGVIKTEAALNLDNRDYNFGQLMTELAVAIDEYYRQPLDSFEASLF